jgi:hypothetical protein
LPRILKNTSVLIGNSTYIPTANDVDFVKKIKSQKWVYVYFFFGAYRFSAAKQQILGGNLNTKGWIRDQYHKLIYKLKVKDVLIVKTPYEILSINIRSKALIEAREII